VTREDNLKRIEGIGPKIESVLKAAGILSFAQLADTAPERLAEILREAGVRIGYPETWPEQAALAAAADWDGLERLQGQLKGGRRVT
jgi:predicted flap endonuclease-1-like 5' DNA nuclease